MYLNQEPAFPKQAATSGKTGSKQHLYDNPSEAFFQYLIPVITFVVEIELWGILASLLVGQEVKL